MYNSTGGNGGACTAVGTTLAGAFGAVLSALAPGKSFVVTGIPLLTFVSAVRPVIGAASGLFLYLAFEAGILEVGIMAVDNVVELYVLAVGFGFSGERALFNLLGGIAGKSDSTIGARFG